MKLPCAQHLSSKSYGFKVSICTGILTIQVIHYMQTGPKETEGEISNFTA